MQRKSNPIDQHIDRLLHAFTAVDALDMGGPGREARIEQCAQSLGEVIGQMHDAVDMDAQMHGVPLDADSVLEHIYSTALRKFFEQKLASVASAQHGARSTDILMERIQVEFGEKQEIVFAYMDCDADVGSSLAAEMLASTLGTGHGK